MLKKIEDIHDLEQELVKIEGEFLNFFLLKKIFPKMSRNSRQLDSIICKWLQITIPDSENWAGPCMATDNPR